VQVFWSRHLLLVMTCLFLSIGPGADADTPAAWSALPDALSGVRAAFLSNNAARMARLFSRRAPVVVSVPPIADGCLAPGPMRAFLDRLVRERVSLAFELPPHSPPPSGLADFSSEEPAPVFIRVKWTHRPAASATLQVEYLHLALRYAAEDSEWQIVEMRTTMR
jgi:hypothetical protein